MCSSENPTSLHQTNKQNSTHCILLNQFLFILLINIFHTLNAIVTWKSNVKKIIVKIQEKKIEELLFQYMLYGSIKLNYLLLYIYINNNQ